MNPDSAIRKINRTLSAIIHEDLNILKHIKHYVIESGGKRIRPLLHLVFTDLLGYQGEDRWVVASIIELIHAASLLHDDVVDQATTRRGKKTVGALYGNKTAILAGDFLLACGIERLNRLHSPVLMDIFTEVIRDLSVSELLQMEWEKDPGITEEIYQKIIYGKTSSLFGASTESAAILSGFDRKKARKIRNFGISLGNVFQMRDDCLDYFPIEKNSGKDFLKDFRNKLYTYPLLVLRKILPPKERKKIPGILESSNDTEILHWMGTHRVSDLVKQDINGKLENLLDFLKEFPENPSRKLLEEQIQKLRIP